MGNEDVVEEKKDGDKKEKKERREKFGPSLTAVGCTKDNNSIITGNTIGQMKLWDFSKIHFNNKDDPPSFDKVSIKWFIIAHKSMINGISVVEAFDD